MENRWLGRSGLKIAVGLLSPEAMERIETILDNKPCPEPNFC